MCVSAQKNEKKSSLFSKTGDLKISEVSLPYFRAGQFEEI